MDVNSDGFELATFSKKNDIEHLFNTYYARLCLFAHKIIENKEAAEDIVQDVFVKIWNKSIDVTEPAAIKSFLYLSVRNACLNYLRHVGVEQKFLDSQNSNSTEVDKVLENIIRAEVLGEVHRAIESLPAGCRQVLKLAYFESLKNDAIAKELGVSINTVKTQKQRALQLLRMKLDINTYIFLIMILRP